MFIVDAGASEEEVTRIVDGLQQIITDRGGVIIKRENMGKRQLAYEINHRTEGLYQLFEIEGSGREIAELERRMRVNDQIVRYLTVRVDEDRRRAEKLKAKRARRGGKRSFGAQAAGRGNAGVEKTAGEESEA
jgi:small subunit ribosomal protein S6